MINPANIASVNLYFPNEVSQNYEKFFHMQIAWITISSLLGLVFLKNPPNVVSNLSVYLESASDFKPSSIHSVHEMISMSNPRHLIIFR